MKKLSSENLKSRRQFFKKAAVTLIKPAVVIYTVKVATQPLFGREPY